MKYWEIRVMSNKDEGVLKCNACSEIKPLYRLEIPSASQRIIIHLCKDCLEELQKQIKEAFNEN